MRCRRDRADARGMPALAAVEAATTEALQITMGMNAWEWRWPLSSFVAGMRRGRARARWSGTPVAGHDAGGVRGATGPA